MAMSDEHKAALAEGRRQARAIKVYLEAIGSRRPGRPITKESLTDRLARVEAQLGGSVDPLRRVELLQQRIDVKKALDSLSAAVDIGSLENGFVEHASGYSDRKGISYSAWREAGVSAGVLKKAGIRRSA
ncbi:MAG: hypothetical protein ACE5GC_01270 [Acidimicrobiia bacterium]